MGILVTKNRFRESRQHLQELLWSDRSREQSQPSLRNCVSSIKRAVGSDYSEAIVSSRDYIELNPEMVDIDLHVLDSFPSSNEIEPQTIKVLLDVLNGEFLQGLEQQVKDRAFEDWLNITAPAFKFRCKEIAYQLFGLGVIEEEEFSLELAERFRELDPEDPVPVLHLVRRNALKGNNARARLVFQEYCATTREISGKPPPDHIVDDYRKILSTPKTYRSTRKIESSFNVNTEAPGHTIGSIRINTFLANYDSEPEGSDFSESLTVALSKFSHLVVENIELPQSDKTHSPFIVSGKVSKRDDKFLIKVSVAHSEHTIWRDEDVYENFSDFVRYDNIAIGRLANKIEKVVREREIAYLDSQDPNLSNPRELIYRAIGNMSKMDRSLNQLTAEYFERAESLSSTDSYIYSWKMLWCIFSSGQNWMSSEELRRHISKDFIAKASGIGTSDSIFLAIRGHFAAFIDKNTTFACNLFEQAIGANENSALSWMLSSATYSYLGNSREALRRLQKAKELHEIEPHLAFMYSSAGCLAHFSAGDYEKSAEFGILAISQCPEFTNGYKQAIVALQEAGRLQEANQYAKKLLELDPDFSMEKYQNDIPFVGKEKEIALRALKQAGVN